MNMQELVKVIAHEGYVGFVYRFGRKYYTEEWEMRGTPIPPALKKQKGVRFIFIDHYLKELLNVEIEFCVKNRFNNPLYYDVVE